MLRLHTPISKLLVLVLFVISRDILTGAKNEELFQTDIGNEMKIGLSDRGYRSVQLKCGSDSMLINLETEEDFYGVIYTRGSYYDRHSPCFYDPGNKRGQRSFSIKFPLNKCQTKKEGEIYSNVLVLQHDKELIMPGDAAFNLECDFNKPRDITVNANLQNDRPATSRITLTDADPAHVQTKRGKRSTIESDHNTVILTPDFLQRQKRQQLRKDEL